MAKAYLNVLLKPMGDGFSIVKAHIGKKASGSIGAEHKDNVWATVWVAEATTYDEAVKKVEFVLDRGDLRGLQSLILLKQAVEKDLGRKIGDGTIPELMPPKGERVVAALRGTGQRFTH